MKLNSPTNAKIVGRKRRELLASLTLFLCTGAVNAQTNGNWNVDASGNWSLGTNWSSNPISPGGAGSTVTISNNISAARVVTIDTTQRTVGTLNIGDSVGTSAFTLAESGGATLIFNNAGPDAELNFSGGANGISVPLSLDSSLIVRNSSTMNQTISGAISERSGNTVTITNSGTETGSVTFSGVISNGAGVVALRQNSAASELRLTTFSTVHTYSGGFTLDAGSVYTEGAGKFGTGAVAMNGGIWKTNGSNANYTNAFSMKGDVEISHGNARIVLATNPVTLTGDLDLTVQGGITAGNNDLVFSGVQDGGNGYSLTKRGAGLLVLNHTNVIAGSTYSGGTFIEEGTLMLNGFSSNALLSTGAVTINGGTFNVSSSNTQTIGALILTSGAITGNAQALSASSYNMSSGTVSKVLGGAGNFIKDSTGTVTLSANNVYTGTTTVDDGTLEVSSTGSISNQSAITINSGGELKNNSSTARTGSLTLAGSGSGTANRATLSGTGAIGMSLILDNIGDTLSPGNSPGVLPLGVSQSWESFTYLWEINSFTGSEAGVDYDQITIAGTLDLTGGMGDYVLDITSLTAGNIEGDVSNFDNTERSWTILATASGITGFDAARWTLETSNFTTGGSWNGVFSLAQSGNDLVLSYSQIPEPGVSLMMGVGCLLLLSRIHNKRK